MHIAKEDTTFQRGFQQQYSDQLFQITDVDNSTYPITYKIEDIRHEKIQGSFQYPELSKTTFPANFKIVNSKIKQFTDPTAAAADGEHYKKWILIQIAEYYQPIWIPEKILNRRSREEKQQKKIFSSVFLHFLNG